MNVLLTEMLSPQQLTTPQPSVSLSHPTAVNIQVRHTELRHHANDGQCVVRCLTAVARLPQLDVICFQVGLSSRRSPPVMTLSGSGCVSGWWIGSRRQEIMSV